MRSNPSSPKIESPPRPPERSSSPAPPRTVSNPSEPSIRSLPSPPLRSSSPSAPLSWSSPVPPDRQSSPWRPLMMSLPASPRIRSARGVPFRMSFPALPLTPGEQGSAWAPALPGALRAIAPIAVKTSSPHLRRMFPLRHRLVCKPHRACVPPSSRFKQCARTCRVQNRRAGPPKRRRSEDVSVLTSQPVPLQIQQEALALEPAGVAAEATAGPQDAVAGHDDRHRVGAQCVAGSPHRPRAPGASRHLEIAGRRPVGYPGRGLEDLAREAAGERPVDAKLEAPPSTLEVLVELAAGFVQASPQLEQARRRGRGELVEDALEG